MSSSRKKHIAMSFAGVGLALAAANAVAGSDVVITSTVARIDDPQNPYQACPPTGEASVDVSPGDLVGICYMLTNNSNDLLFYHTLSDDLVGRISESAFPVYASWTIPFVQLFVAGTQSQTRTGTWYSRTAPTNFTPTVIDFGPAGDGVFADGFDGGSSGAGFVDISQVGTRVEGTESVPMPFPFRISDDFYIGVPTSACISPSGAVTFGEALCGGLTPLNGDLGALENIGVPPVLLPILAPFWDELSAGDIYYATLGTAPERRFVVQWTNMQPQAAQGQDGITFQVVLDEASGAVDFVYPKVHFGEGDTSVDAGASATIGMQFTQTRGRQYSLNSPVLHDGMTIHWTPDVVQSHTAVSEPVSINVGMPVIRTLPGAGSGISLAASAGGTASAALEIANDGDRDLAWSVGEASSTANAPRTPARVPENADGKVVLTANPESAAPRGADAEVVPAVAINGRADGPGGNYSPQLVTFNAARPQDGFSVLGDVPPYWYYNHGDFFANDFATYWANQTSFDLVSLAATPYYELYDYLNFGIPPSLLGGLEMRAMKWDPVTRQAYWIGHQVSDTACTSVLLTASIAPALASFVGSTTEACLLNLAIDRNGLVYGVGYDQVLYAIDKTTMRVEPIAPVTIDLESPYWRGTSLDFDDATGDLYLQVYNVQPSVPLFESRIYRLDITTGQTQNLGTFPHQDTWDVDIRALAIARPDPTPCSRPGDVPWLTFDWRNGTIAPGGQTDVSVRADATGLSPGVYEATVCVQSNDPHQRRIALPVHFTVS